jgi:cytochrome oxidase Cu insertion factor (SCO1/SenC/PrrC family)
MRYGLLCTVGAIAVGAAAGAVLPMPQHAIPHEGGHGASPARPELSIPRTAEFDYDLPEPGSYALPPIKRAADGRVLDETGAEQSLPALLTGKITVMAFIYTRCGDICPQATMLLYELHGIASEDPGLRNHLQLITISFDPEHDTPEVMAMHAEALAGESAGWRFLTTSGKDTLHPILAAYDQPIGPKTDPNDPLGPLAHQLRVFLIDREGAVRNIYSVGFLDPRLVMTDVRTILAEESAARGAGWPWLAW